MTQIALKPRTPVRLALITPEGVAVYEDRKPVAVARTAYQWSPEEIEEVRTADLNKEATHE